MRQAAIRRGIVLLSSTILLSGCLKSTAPETASRFASGPNDQLVGHASVQTDGETSPIIQNLKARHSILQADSPYATVASGVLASDARVAEAELRVAILRKKAADRNWLPTLGPRVSLTSLGDLVAEIVVNQVLFDNGRKRAERDLAQAEVEAAAVAMSTDGNKRVADAIGLYLKAAEGREATAQYDAALSDLNHFEWIMDQRVKGGVSNMSDLNVIQQKLADLRAKRSAAQEDAETALAELNAMSASPMDDVRGIGQLGAAPVATDPLSVLEAETARDIALANARIARASHLPGLGAQASIDQNGNTGGGLNVQADQGLGFGTMATLESIELTKDTAERRVSEAREDANREMASLARKYEAYKRQSAEASSLVTQAKSNLDLFQKQYDGGQRKVMEVVGVYETYIRALETALEVKYKAARAELRIAELQGVLASGDRI